MRPETECSVRRLGEGGQLGSPLRAAIRLLLYFGFTLPLMPVQAAAVAFGWPLRKTLPLWYHRHCRRILGFEVEVHGRPSSHHPTLYVANHSSYFDIMILASLVPASFIAKAEVARWPVFGWLARLQRSVFVDRNSRNAAAHRDSVAARLDQGDDLILFPEGTSNDGNRVLPFKSALFAVVEGRPPERAVAVQPVSIAYTRLDGLPMGRYLRPFFAWYGDMEMAAHMWQAVGLGRVTVEVRFHEPVTIDKLGSRKALAEYCHRQVSAGVVAALSGRDFSAALADGTDRHAGATVETGGAGVRRAAVR
ncbi:MAG: 1-acyl-sn-glycerol-3-phosphate acyltransferase [Alphaproteobacteria bacterium]|nr:MAG: 1-acyl-sn-glycerol-3-phosphate acyltransferase [Alphaproteobacteria bacterium]